MTEGLFILAGGSLLAATLVASLVAARLRLPALLLFLGIGMAAGSDGAGWIRFDDYDLARQIGTLALALILFEGGLSSSFAELRPVLRPAIGLAVIGTVVTALVTGLAAAPLLGLAPLHALLLGSIIASTDGAAVFAMLRGSTLRRRLVGILEGEAGMNDPVAILLVVGFIAWIRQPGYGLVDMLWLFVVELGVGAAVGLVVGHAAVAALRRVTFPTAGLYPVATIATATIAFGAAETLHGSGFLAVYLAGLTLGGAAIQAHVTIAMFHQGAAWLAQVVLFLTLGLLVFPSQLSAVALPATALALWIVLVARPVAVAAGTALDRLSSGDRAVLSWAGMRGGVPVVLATFPVLANVPGSLRFFNVVFFAVVISTLLQGLTFEDVARRVGAVVVDLPSRVTRRATPTARPWSPRDGDPAHPISIDGLAVVEHLYSRRDAPGALVILEDGSRAITGATLVVASTGRLRRYAEQRHERAGDADERRWWRELAVALER